MAIKGCLKLLIPATMMSFKDNRCYSAEVAMARLDETRGMGLPAPQFREMNEFIVTFRSAHISPISRPQEPQVSKTLWDEDEQLSALPTSTEELSDKEQRLEKAIVYVQEHGFITNGLYRDITGVTDKRAFRDLELLVERGSLKCVGSKRGRRYELP